MNTLTPLNPTQPPSPTPVPKPLAPLDTKRLVTALVVVIVLLLGGAICLLTAIGVITDPDSKITFGTYLRDVAIALGLLGIGHGIDPGSRP